MLDVLYKIPFWVWLLALWDIIWKLLALWRSARNNHLIWFILLFILNTVGILPLIYILNHRKNDK
ncbi:MAG: DUF5652 family protein [Dysgonamonadaceae bacterium]